MRKTTFVALAIIIIIASCTSTVVTSEKLIVTNADSLIRPVTNVNTDSLYVLLNKKGLIKGTREQTEISVITDRLVDISEPARSTSYLAILIEVPYSRTTGIAVLDPSQKNKLIAFLDQEFPDVLTYVHGDETKDSGQGADLTPWPLQLSEAGDVIAVTARSAKQFVKGSDDDEDVWLFALWKNEIVMLMGYSQKYHHIVSSNAGWSENTWMSNELSVTSSKSKGMYDIVLNGHRKVSSGTKSANEDVDTFVKYIFNGKEYILD